MTRALPLLWAVLGVASAAAGGIASWLAADDEVVAYGGSYEPLASAYSSRLELSFDGSAVLWDRQRLVAACLVVAGLLVLAALGGWSLGRRRPVGR